MRLKNEDYALLKRVHWELQSGGKDELAAQLQDLLSRFEASRDATRKNNRERAKANRQAGYAWNSADRPKVSKYYEQADD